MKVKETAVHANTTCCFCTLPYFVWSEYFDSIEIFALVFFLSNWLNWMYELDVNKSYLLVHLVIK